MPNFPRRPLVLTLAVLRVVAADLLPLPAPPPPPFPHASPDMSTPGCLQRANVVYIGDSTLRYEYLELARRLHARYFSQTNSTPASHEHKQARAHSSAACLPSPGYFGCMYNETTDEFDGRMICDCMRLDCKLGRQPCSDDLLGQTVENRVYYGRNSGQSGFLRLSFFQWFGHSYMPRGSLDVLHALKARDPSNHTHLPCAPGYGVPDSWRWNASVEELLRRLSLVKPTHVIINSGHWASSRFTAEQWAGIRSAGDALRPARVFWRTTPRRLNSTLWNVP